jgi:hypothetical protein
MIFIPSKGIYNIFFYLCQRSWPFANISSSQKVLQLSWPITMQSYHTLQDPSANCLYYLGYCKFNLSFTIPSSLEAWLCDQHVRSYLRSYFTHPDWYISMGIGSGHRCELVQGCWYGVNTPLILRLETGHVELFDYSIGFDFSDVKNTVWFSF